MNYLARLQFNKNISCLITAFVLTFSFPSYLYAAGACSPYIGQATLNEFFKDQSNQTIDVDDFAEVKILNDAVTSTIYETWTINICEKDGSGNDSTDTDGCSGNLSLSDFTDKAKPWLVYKNGSIGSDIDIGKYINLKSGFDATLLDANGDLVDYLTVDGYSKAITGISCNLSNLVFDYQATIPGNQDKTIFRSPDGTGDWDGAPAATAPPTEDNTNDNLPTPPAGETYPIITINNINVYIGGNAVFTVSLVDSSGASKTFSQAVTVSYYTQDGTATVADGDYTAVPLTGTPSTVSIAAGQSSTTITIASPSSNYADIGQIFYAVLNAVENSATNGGKPNATISKHFGEAKLDASGCSFTSTGIIGEGKIDVDDNNITFNNGTSSTTLTQGETTTNNSIILKGSIINQTLTLPTLPSISWVNSPDPTLSNGDSLPSPATTYDYDRVTITNNATITIGAGTYNIDEFNIGQGVTINVTGKVIINTNEFLYTGGGGSGNINVNTGGDPANFRINLYNNHDAEFDLGDNSSFTGIIFSPFSNTKVEIDDDNTFIGGIFTNGEVQLKDGSIITYNDAARAAAFSVLGCLPIRTPPTVASQVNASSTPTITGTYDSSDAAGGFTVTVAGTTYTLGTSSQLTASGNNWTLAITTPITAGIYNVVASSTNGFGNIISDTTTNELTVGAGSCFSDSYPIFAGKDLDIKDNNISFTYSGTTTTLTEAKTADGAINTSGATSSQTPSLPTLPAIMFVTTPDASLSNGDTLAPGNYDVVTIANNATITLSAGTFNVDQFLIGKGVTINVSGAVIINTNEFVYSGGGAGNITVNSGGDPANFIVNIYSGHNAEFDIEDNSSFTGIIFSSFSNTTIEIDDDNTFTGAIFSNGDVDLKDGSSINFTTAAKTAAAKVLKCNVNTINHFSINYSSTTSTGINCQPSSITIEAHDANHDVVTTHTGLINLTTTTNGDWSKTATTTDANGTLTPGVADSGSAAYTFVTADNGSIILNFRDVNVEIVNLNVNGSSVTEKSNAAVANDDYEIDFKSSGFIYTIPTQTSCATSASISIRAVRTDNTTNQCVSAFKDKDRTLKVWASYANPTPASITGSPAVTLVNGNDSYPLTSTEATAVDVNMSFVDNAGDNYETFTINYPDAGQLTLNTKYIGSAANSDTGLTMLGNTTFVVKPAKLYVYSDDTNASCISGDPTNADCNPVFRKTGENFNLKVRGACADNTVTPNFQLNNIAITSNLVAPTSAGTTNANLNITSTNIAPADNGEHIISTQNVDQVGVFTFTATIPATGYLGETVIGTNLLNTSANIGRFTPDHFDTLVTHGCSGSGNFTYSGQPFTVTATARNHNNLNMVNYREGFAGVTLSDATPAATPFGTFTNNTIPAANFTSTGTGSGSQNNVMYTFTNKKTTPEILKIRSTDFNKTAISTDDINSNGFTEGTTEIRSGRTRVENSYGSELVDMAVTTQTEYYTSNGFILNTSDTCSAVNVSLTDIGTDTIALGTGAGQTCIWDDVGTSVETTDYSCNNDATKPQFYEPAVNGNFNLFLKSPGANNTGDIGVTLISPTWLKFDWDGDGAHDDDPTGIASFGLYRGDDRIIYWREVFQ